MYNCATHYFADTLAQIFALPFLSTISGTTFFCLVFSQTTFDSASAISVASKKIIAEKLGKYEMQQCHVDTHTYRNILPALVDAHQQRFLLRDVGQCAWWIHCWFLKRKQKKEKKAEKKLKYFILLQTKRHVQHMYLWLCAVFSHLRHGKIHQTHRQNDEHANRHENKL